ncbi:MAG TPA: IgGFc-binding protein, partial [Flavobacteriales bacterium]|nr:IgGFc-binding protein [Flavobacteriales bacterium]
IVQLDSGETYQVQTIGDGTDLQSSTIVGTPTSGSCRPFAVFSGAKCTDIPSSCTACDHIYDQNLPTSVWGKTYYTVPFDPMTGYTYRIMARDNGTQVTIDGGAPVNYNAGQTQEFNFRRPRIVFRPTVPSPSHSTWKVSRAQVVMPASAILRCSY